jgi:hypothetical protein
MDVTAASATITGLSPVTSYRVWVRSNCGNGSYGAWIVPVDFTTTCTPVTAFVQNFDAAIMTPQIVKRPLDYMTPGWKDAFLFTTKLADSLGLEMAIAGSPGWSESGGPWVRAKDGMKKIVWSETRVKGGQPFTDTLPKPPTTTGAFQNLPYEENLGSTAAAPPQYYEDISVVAYRVPATDIPLTELNPRVNSSGGDFTLSQLTDGGGLTRPVHSHDQHHGRRLRDTHRRPVACLQDLQQVFADQAPQFPGIPDQFAIHPLPNPVQDFFGGSDPDVGAD